ncbi:MAG TPA: hypothetical protein VN213_18195, partial [Solirubrobacteraceae bacterium]|nr:hypothetical protein [Solirubrobacteraceae bacterium]
APLPEPAAGDAPWARAFGAISVAAYPGAIAVRGKEVFLGGEFTLQMAGMPDYTYVRIAHWDGVGWRRMGDGVDGTVRAIAVVGEEVYAGGEFAAAGGTPAASLARWDGTAWSAVAGGVRSSVAWIQASVRALASDGTRLFVAGVFDSVGPEDDPVAANGFAVLDLGTGAWETYDGGLWSAGEPGEGRALALAGDRLYVGGSFDRAGAVDTAGFAALDLPAGRWEGFGAGVRNGDFPGTVDSLAVAAATGTVFLGGRFTHADTVETCGVATFGGGKYGSLGGFTYYDGTTGVNVVALAHAGGRLHAAGEFTAAGGVPAQHWVMHDGTAWSVPAEVSNPVLALAAYGDGVVVAGTFGYSGALRVPHAGIWTPGGWQTFGQGVAYDPYADTSVFALAATDSGVYAGGYFDQVGPVPVASVAEWRDGRWRDMAGGVQSPSALGEVFAMLAVGDELYITGQFETAGGVAAANIARWDGERWWPLGAGIQGMGLALAMLAGRLYVGGGFYLAGDVPAYNVASWDPATETWSAVGSAPVYDGQVLALAGLRDRYLVVGGGFTKLYAGRFQVSNLNSIVLFDTHAPPEPANPWAGYSRLPGVTTGWMAGVVQAMRVIGDDLYVGGAFSEAGVEAWADPPVEGFPAANLAVWRYRGGEPGKEWSAPAGTDQAVTAFDTLDGRSLVVGGWFGSAGGLPAGAVAELDPATGTWTTYGSGIGFGARGGRQAQALAQSAAAGLWVGGTFTVAGGA